MTNVPCGLQAADGRAPGTLRLRPAVAADVPAIAGVCVRATRTAYVPLVGEAYVARVVAHWYGRERLLREVAPSPQWFGFTVAELDGTIAGVAGTGRTADPSTCELFTLYVDPDRQRRGVGRSLVAHAARQARQAGASRLLAAVMPGNAPAIAFYERCGFRAAGDRPIYAPHGAEGGPDVALVYVVTFTQLET